MHSTRQRILHYLRTHEAASAVEVSRALNMTPANARYHLSALVEQGAVEVAGHRPPQGRGRPSQVYRLNQGAAGVVSLARALLQTLLADELSRGREERLRQVADNLLGDRRGSEAGLAQRLTAAVRVLNELQYQARWEAHAGGPRLILTRCPFAALAQDHSAVCRIESYLLESLLGVPVRQVTRLEMSPQGLLQCIFTTE